MPIVQGPVKSVKASGRDKSPNKEHETGEDGEAGGSDVGVACYLCSKPVALDARMRCLAGHRCKAAFHVICLSESFLAGSGEADQIIPVQGSCPECRSVVQWGDLVRRMRGCFKNLHQETESDYDEIE